MHRVCINKRPVLNSSITLNGSKQEHISQVSKITFFYLKIKYLSIDLYKILINFFILRSQ